MIEILRKIRQARIWSMAGASCLAFVGLQWTLDATAVGRDQGAALSRGRRNGVVLSKALSKPAPGVRLLGVREVASRVDRGGGPVDVLVREPFGDSVFTARAFERRFAGYDWVEDVAFETSSQESIEWLPVSLEDKPRGEGGGAGILIDGGHWECGEIYKTSPMAVIFGLGENERFADIKNVELRGTANQRDAEIEQRLYRRKCYKTSPLGATDTFWPSSYVRPPENEPKPFVRIETIDKPFVAKRWSKSNKEADFPVEKEIRGYRLLHVSNGLADPRHVTLRESALRQEQASGCVSVTEVPVQRLVEASFPAAKGQPVLFHEKKWTTIRTAQGQVYPYRVSAVEGKKQVKAPKVVTSFYGVLERPAWTERIDVLIVHASDGPWYWPSHTVESWIETRFIQHEAKWKHIPFYKAVVEAFEEKLPAQIFHLNKGIWGVKSESAEYDALSEGILYEQPGNDGQIPKSWGRPERRVFRLTDGTRFDKDSPLAWAYAGLKAIPQACEAAPEPLAEAARPVAGPGPGAGAGTGSARPGLAGRPGSSQAPGSAGGGQMAKRRMLAMMDAPTGLQIGDPVIAGDVSAGRAARHASVAAQRKLVGAQQVQSAGAGHKQGRSDLLDDLFARARLGELRLVDERGREVFRGVLKGNAILLQAQPGGPILPLARGSRLGRGADGRTAIEIVSAREGLIEGTFRTPAGTWSRLYY